MLFLDTKMTGAGRKIETLPCWISRASFSGHDWVGVLQGLLLLPAFKPPPGKFLRDPATGLGMTYAIKMGITRQIIQKVDLRCARHLLFPGRDVVEGSDKISVELASLFTEHGSRGILTYRGTQLGAISAARLNFLGRWVPGTSVEDNRLIV